MSPILNIITSNSFIPNCLKKKLKMFWNCYIVKNLLKIYTMGSKRYMMLRIWRKKMLKMVQKFFKWHETGKNGVRQLKWMKIVQDCTKWFKSGPKRTKKIWAIESASQLKTFPVYTLAYLTKLYWAFDLT